ncbi:MAG: CHAT domain-containing protein, partial [Acidimicrobiales bacterium]
IAGPGLPAAVDEVEHVHEMYEGSTMLVGERANVEASLAAAADADLLHVAAHGTFRADSPMFSALHLADGPLTVYDIERLQSVPSTVVLSACHAATADVAVGNEVMGTAMALVGMGVTTVVAPLVAVADEATAAVMVAMHELIRGGASPQEALARLIAEWLDDNPMLAATAGAFVVIGSDDRPA